LPDGAFQPEHRLADLTDEAADAEAEGYACLQVIADMSWALRPQLVAELVLSYEARLTPLCAEWRMAVACSPRYRTVGPGSPVARLLASRIWRWRRRGRRWTASGRSMDKVDIELG
jgi:hypothetical protein